MNAPKENLSRGLFVIRALLVCTANQIWKHKTVPLPVRPATHVRKERIRRQQVLLTPPIATIVPRANIPRKKEIPRQATATIVKPTHLVPNLDETNRVTRAKKARLQNKVQPFVLPAMLVPF